MPRIRPTAWLITCCSIITSSILKVALPRKASILRRSFSTGDAMPPSRVEHLTQSENNERLALRLARTGEFGWGITCLFYAALHLVEAYLGDMGRSTGNHNRRDQEL